MRRVRNWDVALALWAREQLGRPWRWGETDCGSLVVGALEVLYGERPEGLPEEWYGSALEAARMHRETGGVEAALRGLGAEEVPPLFLQRGDVLVVPPSPERAEEGVLPAAAVAVDEATVLTADEEAGVEAEPAAAVAALPGATLLRLPYG